MLDPDRGPVPDCGPLPDRGPIPRSRADFREGANSLAHNQYLILIDVDVYKD